MRRIRLAVLTLVWLACAAGLRAQSPAQVLELKAEGPLTPAMVSYIRRGIDTATQQGSRVVVLQLNTPGGQTDLMEQIIGAIVSSRTPVVVYVAPAGAVAGSAGALITLAGHASGMAPQTAIGAASPVGGQGEDIGQTMEAKVKNVLKAQARNLTAARGAEAVELAEAMIEEAKAVTAEEARAAGLIDVIAVDTADLLGQLDGRQVNVLGQPVTLRTGDATVQTLEMNFVESLLNLLTNPNILFILLFIGVQAILAELSSPGIGLPGLVGVVCLALAFYGLGVLPVNWFGLLFVGLAVVLFVIDLQTAGLGVLSAGAVVSLAVGALVLFNSPGTPVYFQVSVPLVIIGSLAMGLVFLALVVAVLRTRRLPVKVSVNQLVGQVGEVRQMLNPIGTVQVAGELWTSETADGERIPAGQKVVVLAVDGLKLKVRRHEDGEAHPAPDPTRTNP